MLHLHGPYSEKVECARSAKIYSWKIHSIVHSCGYNTLKDILIKYYYIFQFHTTSQINSMLPECVIRGTWFAG